MDEKRRMEDNFAHLLRIALNGGPVEVAAFGRRVAKMERARSPEFAGRLVELLEQSQSISTKAALRKSAQAVIPVDRESRLDLLIIEDPVMVTEQPVLPDSIQRSINQVLEESRRSEALIEKGLEPTHTLLLEGPPGVGKTLTARWIAASLNKPLYTLNLASVMSSFLGRTGSNLNAVISFAKNSNGVLFLDEFDSIAKKRDDLSEVGELKRLVTVLLQEIDNWPSDKLLVAATNHGDLLDTAVWRRFSVICKLPLPTKDQLDAYIRSELNAGVSDTYIEILKLLFSEKSFSYTKEFLNTCRKRTFLYNESFEASVVSQISEMAKNMAKSDLKNLSNQLLDTGLSQRGVSEITGISRDTIRKINRIGELNG